MAVPKKSAPKAPPKKDPLAALRMSDMVISKPFLPIELFLRIVNYLHGSDLIGMARVSRKLHEMIYDNGIWIRRLDAMGVWSHAEARNQSTHSRTASTQQKTPTSSEARMNGQFRSQTLSYGSPAAVHGRTLPRALADGFDVVALGNSDLTSATSLQDGLRVLQNVRSIRDQARQEYGTVYRALNGFYSDMLSVSRYDRSQIIAQFKRPEQQAAMFANVRQFAQGDPSPGSSRRSAQLLDIIAQFDRVAVLEFRSGYEYKDINGRMKEYAAVSHILTGGQSTIDLYLNDNRLLARKAELGSVSDCVDYSLGSGQLSLERVNAYFDRLGYAYSQEAAIIKTVFPQASEVSLLYLERIGNEILQPFLTALFNDARTRSTSVYLRVISGSLHATSRFVQNFALPERPDEAAITRASAVLVQLFEPHLQTYLEEELTFFKQAAQNDIDRWDRSLAAQVASTEGFLMSNINRQADKKDFMASFKKVVMMPVNILPSFSTTRPAIKRTISDSHSLSRPVSPGPRSGSPALPATAPTDELAAKAALMTSRLDNIKTLFSMEVALNLVHAAKTSLERAAQFIALGGAPGEIARQRCAEIYLVLVESIGSKHVQPGFDKAIEHLSAYNPRAQDSHAQQHTGPVVAPLTTFLELVNIGDLIQQMLDVFFEQEVVAMGIVRRDDFMTAPVKAKRQFEQMLDEHVASGLGKGIDVLMDEVEYLCATEQSPTDFNPITQVFDAETVNKRASIFGVGDIDVRPTKPCVHIIEIVSIHVEMLHGSTDKALIDVFVQEVAQRLFQALVKHIQRQRVSPLGAMRLLSDLVAYAQHISSYRNPNLSQYFNALREVAQIYLFEAKTDRELDEMCSIIADAERYRGVFTVEEVLEFAERRSDWLTIRNKVESRVKGENCLIM